MLKVASNKRENTIALRFTLERERILELVFLVVFSFLRLINGWVI
jgi:hypothetical protein